MREPLRLLLVTHSLSGGGAERFVANLAAGLDRERFAPMIAAATAGTSYAIPPEVPVHRLGYRGLASLPGAILRLRHLIRESRPQVVLSNVLATNGLTGAALAGLTGRPRWIARIGNAPAESDPPWQRAWARRAYRWADLAVANSRALAAAVEEVYPVLQGRVRSLPNPTDFEGLDRLAAEAPAVDRPPAGAVLLWVGRLVPQKRPDLLLRAFAAVRRDLDAQLWVCGEGPLAPAMRELARDLGVVSAVSWLGFCENPFALMRHADLFLLTSDFEGLPNALIEAQGLGLPAVSTRCPFGPEEIVEEGVTGRLVAPGNPEALAGATTELLADPALRERMGEAARRLARERFGLPGVLPRWEALLTETAEGT